MTKLITFLGSLHFLLFFNSCTNNASELNLSKTSNFPSVKFSLPQENNDSVRTLTQDQALQIKRLDDYFNQLYSKKEFNGNIIISKKGKVIYHRSFGIADSKSKKKLKVNSVFQLASVSKTLTSTLILMLYQEGKLDIFQKVTNYLPDFPYPDVTVDNLLAHRSGLPNYLYFTTNYANPDSAGFNNEIVYRLMTKNAPKSYAKPDRVFDYSNTNYFLLSLVVEKVSGKRFEDVMREKIFKPLGMLNTYFYSESSIIPDSLNTIGHDERMRVLLPDHFDPVKGDKGIFSTTYDMLLFLEAFHNYKLLSKNMVELATSPKSKEKKVNNYGYGWRLKDFETTDKLVFHNGWWRGYRTALHRYLKDSTSVVVLTNNLSLNAYRVKDFLYVLNGVPPDSLPSSQPNEH